MRFFSPLEQFDAIFLYNIFISKILWWDLYFIDFSFIHIIVPLIILISIFLILVIFSNYFTLIPSTIFQRLFEYNLKFILNLIKQQIGVIGYKYIVLLFCIFFGILLLNLLSVLPFGIALTSHLIIILFLSLSICIGIFIEGNIVLGFQFYKVFLPRSPLVMLPLLMLIEIFSYI